MKKFAVILPAAGQSRRFQDKHYKKPFIPLAGRAVWLHSAERFMNRADVQQTILVIGAEDREEFDRKFGANVAILGIDVVLGGAERSDSVAAAIQKLHDDVEYVAIHDAARPCLADRWIDEVFEAAERDGAAILATPIADTLKRAKPLDPGRLQIAETVDRSSLWAAQTPQVFRRDWLVDAYAALGGGAATDDADLVERWGYPVTIVEGSPLNLKITTQADLRLAEQILKVLPKPKGNTGNPFANDDLWR